MEIATKFSGSEVVKGQGHSEIRCTPSTCGRSSVVRPAEALYVRQRHIERSSSLLAFLEEEMTIMRRSSVEVS